MEQLVLGFFQEQLSKVIVGFRKEQVNANLLNGKGEITDVSLNCAVINEAVRKVSPLLEFKEIHVNRLGFHVTAWANLRKAPIVVDIGVITAVVHEPLQCLPKKYRKKMLILTEKELVQLILHGLYKPLRGNGSYGFVDRIVDNLTIEVEALRLSYQAWGKFKTRRVGPWTPPTVHCEVQQLKVVSVDQYGHESTPDQVWAHNRMGMQEFFMYKKISGEIHVQIIDVLHQKAVGVIRRLAFETQAAIKRRLRDGAVLGVQLDLTIPSVDIEIESSDIPLLAHWVVATQYCVAKDRSFEDPLVPESSEKTPEIPTPSSASDNIEKENSGEDDEEEEGLEEGDNDDDSVEESPTDMATDVASLGPDDNDETDTNDGTMETPRLSTSGSSLDAPFKQRPLILLPNGLVIYENVCFTCSIDNLTIRGVYANGQNGFVQISSKGCITELIWPKANNESGLYLQTSVSFMSVQERLDRRVRTILIGGIAHGDHMSIHKVSKKPHEVHADENFPLFERRVIRDDPLDLRHTFPSQAFGAKTTIDIASNNDDEDGDDENLPPMVMHEVGIDEFDILLDAHAWFRALRFFLNEDGGGFDPRWHTGDWTEFLTPEMLKDPKGELQLDDHVQNAKQILLDENFMISSDRCNVTARFSNVELRIPAPVSENVRSCDIIVQIKENTLVISSISGDSLTSKAVIDFPNDPSDLAYSLEKSEDPSLRLSGVKLSRNVSTFRVQLTVKGFEINIIPIIPFCDALETRQLIAPMSMTMIACFEGEPPSTESNFTKIALFVSMHVHKFCLNIDFDLLAGATGGIIHHIDVIEESMAKISELLATSPSSTKALNHVTKDGSSGKVKKSLRGKRVMVRRHIDQSKETGGLGVVFCLQVSECAITIWRQNVPYTSPLRHRGDCEDTENGTWVQVQEQHFRLLKLVDTHLREFELGVEFDFQAQQGRRTVVKLCLEEGCVSVCHVGQAMGYNVSASLPTAQDLSDDVNTAAQWNMVELVTFGMEKLPGKLNASYSGENQQVAIRLEEQLRNGTRSWSLSADLNCPTTVNACVEEVKDTIILLIEALLLPTWSQREFPPMEGAPFPKKTIGAMFYSICTPSTAQPKSFDITWDQIPSNKNKSSDPFVERALRVIFKLLLPADIQLVLLRVEIANLLLSIPDSISDNERRSLGLHLMQTDLAVRFYPSPGTKPSDMEDILACKGVAWSSLIQTKEEGYYQRIRSRQSLISISLNGGELEIEELVHPFNIGLTYAAAKVHLAMDEDLQVNDIRRIESFFEGMKEIQERSIRYQSELAYFLRAVKQPISDNMEDSPEKKDICPIPTSNASAALEPHDDDNARILRTQLMLRRAHEELGRYEKDIRLALQRKNDQLATLQRKVFVGEAHRFAALALLSSNVAGWIRTGGVHRIGQRVARKSTLWPYWAVLRKNLLILYSSPGEPKPSDVILLEGAKIRRLAGGRNTQDIKRGFAIIESGGITRYFITSTSQEFSRWIQEINDVINMYRGGKLHGSGDEEVVSDGGVDDEATSESLENDPVELSGHRTEYGGASQDREGENLLHSRRLGTRFAGAKTRLGAALENARQIGKELSDRNRDASSRVSDLNAQISSRDDPSKEINIAEHCVSAAVVERDDIDLSGMENAASNDLAANEGYDGASANTRRRLQFGKALTGMKQVTKNKLGAAIQNVRQKGVEASARRLIAAPQEARGGITTNQNLSSSFGGENVNEAGPCPYWTCMACTFINKIQSSQPSCEMCGAKITALSNDANDTMRSAEIDNVNEDFGPVTPSEVVESCTANESTSQVDDTLRGRLGAKISAVVRNGRQNSMEDANDENQEARGRGIGMSSARFNLKKLRRGTSSESLFDDSAVTLKQVHASSLTPSIGASIPRKIPLKLLDGNWIVSVKPRIPQSRKLTINGFPGTESRYGAKSETSVGGLLQSDNQDHSEMGRNPESKSLFDIRTHRRDSTEKQSAVQTTCSIGTLMELHAAVSESVGQILPQLSREHFREHDHEGWLCPLQGDDSFNLVENVLIIGRTLGGFFDPEISQENLEKTREYQAEITEWFLNSLLRCPLPLETLVDVSDFLGICASTKNAVTSESESVEPPLATQKPGNSDASREEQNSMQCGTVDTKNSEIQNLSTVRPQKILGLLSACGTELLRVETSGKPATPSPAVRPHALHQETAPAPMNTQIYEPLLPPSVSHQMQLAMHEALVNVMGERDEAHAQLIASNVLHVHELEQERKKNEKLRIEQELKEARRQLQQPNVGNFFQNLNDDRSRRILDARLRDCERILERNTDEELADTSRQLADEVSAKTSHALEIVRLKETREIERKNEAAEKQALKDELRRVKALLAQQEARAAELTLEEAKSHRKPS